MLPLNAQTYSTEIVGTTTIQILHNIGSHTDHKFERVISVSVSNTDTEIEVTCGSENIAFFDDNETAQMFLNIDCIDSVEVENVGMGGSAFVSVNMLHDEPIFTIGTSSSSTSPYTSLSTINGFSYGEIMITLILFLMLTIMFFGGLWNRVIGIKKKISASNKFLGNNSEEGKRIYRD